VSILPKTPLSQALTIVFLGVAVGLAGNQISRRCLPLFPPPPPVASAGAFITLEQAKQLWQTGAGIFLDAREPADFAAGHIGNALNLPAQSFPKHFAELAPLLTGSPLILYCDGQDCDLSHRLAESLRQQGHTNLHILPNGWTVWLRAGLPTTSRSPK
jgi:rhodanese-related sulfurtransferase